MWGQVMTSHLSFLHDSIKINHLENNQVEVTVVLPSELFLHFIRTLDSLTGFAQYLETQSKLYRLQRSKQSQAFNETARIAKENYYKRIAAEFDRYSEQGLKRYDIIKRISATLRKENHPWSSPDLVRPSLIAAGRGGRVGRPRKQS